MAGIGEKVMLADLSPVIVLWKTELQEAAHGTRYGVRDVDKIDRCIVGTQ